MPQKGNGNTGNTTPAKPDNNGGVNPGGGHNNRPNQGGVNPGPNDRPNQGGMGPNSSHSARPNTSAGKPGGPVGPYRPNVNRPHQNYYRPNYQPPRPHGGFWGAPPVNIYRPVYFAPVPPPRVYIRPGIPSLGTILGLTFGTFIDTSLNLLYNSGYNVLGYANNMVYLSNVRQLGYLWPEATIYYADGLVSDMQFQYWTMSPASSRYNQVYNSLVRTYGAPVESFINNGVTTTSWWAGGNTGFITLQYGPGLAENGMTYYYTTLTYSDNYL